MQPQPRRPNTLAVHSVDRFVFSVPNLDEAVKWAARCPAAQGGSIEVRPVGMTPDIN